MTLRNHQGLFVALAILYYLSTSFASVSTGSIPIPSVSSIHKHGPWEDSYKFNTFHPGQNYKGLSNVKNYFHQLGYIPNAPPSSFDDNFDDTLVSAIQTYQKNYNLNITGKLDHNTLRQIMTPRCGIPDIIKTNTKTSFGSDNTHSLLHTVPHYTFLDGMPRWPKGTKQLTYAFLPRTRARTTITSAIARAFARWTPVVNITFKETTSYRTAKIKIRFARRSHGDGAPFDGPLGVTAHASGPNDAKCHFDADESWVAVGDVTKAKVKTAIDLESVAVHEIGHLLGLGHSLDEKAIMYAYLPTLTRKVDLTKDDIQGIQRLYT
ncbi:Metalloendoproteinase 1 [Spatholobus suberectus]|nr:Metalloendoproteinase 1 [Spatholobus suberectus]